MKTFILLFGYLAVALLVVHAALASPAGVAVGREGGIMQQRSDALVKRDPDPIIETCQPGVCPTPSDVTQHLDYIVGYLKDAFFGYPSVPAQETVFREQFTQSAVQDCFESWGTYNWVIDHNLYGYEPIGLQGIYWNKVDYVVNLEEAYRYTINWLKTGNYTHYYDGGYQNYAVLGYFTKTFDGQYPVYNFQTPPS